MIDRVYALYDLQKTMNPFPGRTELGFSPMWHGGPPARTRPAEPDKPPTAYLGLAALV
jgi:hypothetical protein